MFPVLFRIGSFEVTSFGAMVALGAILGLWTLRHEARARGLPPAASDLGVWALVGGLLGAKLLYVAEHAGQAAITTLLFDRGGLSWFGGFAGGLAAGLVAARRARLPWLPLLAAAAPALSVGQAVGRIGCFLVGDDYGRPTSLPWGVAFPRGIPPTTVRVHPTQLYEALLLAGLAALLVLWRRRGVDDARLLATYCGVAGAGRFLIEILRVNARVALGLTVAQWASLALVLASVTLLLWRRGAAGGGRRSSFAAGERSRMSGPPGGSA
jgi:phosphatidylglycerol:prolipoprotein diacylglycerol transferase